MTLRYRNARGYTATIIAVCDDRVLYDCNDEDGKAIQRNGCVSSAYFFENWKPA